MTTKTVTTFRVPPSTDYRFGDQPDPWSAVRPDDVRVLTDRVVGDGNHDARWRAAAALRLAALVLDGTDAVPGTPIQRIRVRTADAVPVAVVRRLDAALPALLRSAEPAEAASLTALCAVLGDRLSHDVCPPLQELVRRAAPPVAVAAHVASLLVEGLGPSAQHVADLTAMADPDPEIVAAHRHCPTQERAAALACALAVADRRAGGRTPSRAALGPKVAATCRFGRTTGRRAAIGSFDDVTGVTDGTSGARVHPADDQDLRPCPPRSAASRPGR